MLIVSRSKAHRNPHTPERRAAPSTMTRYNSPSGSSAVYSMNRPACAGVHRCASDGLSGSSSIPAHGL